MGSIPGQVSEFLIICFVEFILLDENYEKSRLSVQQSLTDLRFGQIGVPVFFPSFADGAKGF